MPQLIEKESSQLSVHVSVAKIAYVMLYLCGSLCSVTTTVATCSDDIIIAHRGRERERA
jgi:hypothetical protein